MASALLLWGPGREGTATAQRLPTTEWAEPEVISPLEPSQMPTEQPREAATVSPQDLALPLNQDEIGRIHAEAESAVLPIRAIHRQAPMIYPETVERQGVATLVDYGGGGPVFITASILVQGAERVSLEAGGRTVEARVISDARYGLAMLVPEQDLTGAAVPVALHPVGAEEVVEVFSTGPNTSGAAIGAGEGMYEYYQVTTLGVTSGHPLVNRRGDLIGIGSHQHPNRPGFSLSVPSEQVAAFIDAVSSQ